MNVAGVALGRWRLLRNTLSGRSRRGPRPWLGLVLAAMVAAVLMTAFQATFATFAAGVGGVESAASLLAAILTAALVALIVFDLHYLVSAVLLDSDLDLLRRAPLSPAGLLALKLVDALPRTSPVLVILLIPAVVAFAAAAPLPVWAWALAPFQLLAMWLIPLALGLAVALMVLRRVPARRAREALGLLSTLMLTALWLANSFLLPKAADPGAWEALRGGRVFGDAFGLDALSPAHWLARSLVAAHGGDVAGALAGTARLAAGALIAVGVALAVAARDLETALAQIGSGAAKRGKPKRRATASAKPRYAVLELARRDLRLFARDWTVLSDLLAAAVLWTLLPLVGAPLLDVPPPVLVRSMLTLLAVALGYEIAARSIPFEKLGFAWTRLAPLPPSRWVIAKLLSSAALAGPLVALAAGSLMLSLPMAASEWLAIIPGVTVALGLSLSLGILTGTLFADWGWTNPRAMLTLAGRLVATGLIAVQAGLWIGLPAIAEALEWQLPGGFLAWVPLAVAGLASLTSLRVAARRITTLEWP
ncbi:MAG TPA: hypothetical protein VEY91_02955 [Candidatus Limnocylindria bacterium]|nr:hypothetical protein [Candidatus Limnocylindria bacterium]